MYREPLPINVGGLWSPRQAFHVIEACRDVAQRQGLMLVPVNVTEHGMPYPRVMILTLCERHNVGVDVNSVCRRCALEWPR